MSEIENKYAKAIIYAVRSPNINKFYIGSTICSVKKRFIQHKSKINLTKCKIIIDAGESYIEILEQYPCNNKKELEKREGELIRLHKDNIVNYIIVGRTYNQYYKDNKDKKKEYALNNKDKLDEYRKQYKQDNKDIIKQRKAAKINCECGSMICKSDKAKHNKTLKHLKYMLSLQPKNES